MEVINLQKNINLTNLNLKLNDSNKDINNNNYHGHNNNLVNFNENMNEVNFLTLGNNDISSSEKKETERKRQSNFKSNNISEINSQISFGDYSINKEEEEKETTKFLVSQRASSKTHRSLNKRGVSFTLTKTDKIKPNNIFLQKENSMFMKMKRYNSTKHVEKLSTNKNNYTTQQDYKTFFYLTFESIKLNSTKEQFFKEIDVEKLYKYTLVHSIPFYKVYIYFFY
jgi:hypothetical protein